MKKLKLIFTTVLFVLSLVSCNSQEQKIVKAEDTVECIESLKQDTKLIVTGELTNVLLGEIMYAMDKSENKIALDLTKTTGLTLITGIVSNGCTSLTSITLPDSVTEIEEGAFYGYTSLTSITIPNSVKIIRKGAFCRCSSLTNITISDSVEHIYGNPFAICSNLKKINVAPKNKFYDSRNNCNAIIETANNNLITGCANTVIPNSVTKIGEGAFAGCTLISLTIPDSVTEIGEEAFSGCLGLEKISVSSENKVYDSRNNCNAIIRTADNELITGCANTVIPNSVTKIGGEAFYGCTGLTNIIIPDSVTEIGDSAFSGCTNLTPKFKEELANRFGYYTDNDY